VAAGESCLRGVVCSEIMILYALLHHVHA